VAFWLALKLLYLIFLRSLFTTTVVKNILDGFTWQLVVVYGSVYAEHKLDFLS
jgi:hypothetical protein